MRHFRHKSKTKNKENFLIFTFNYLQFNKISNKIDYIVIDIRGGNIYFF